MKPFLNELLELTEGLRNSINDLTSESFGMKNDQKEICPICLEIPERLDNNQLHYCPEKYLPGFGHKHCDIQCHHSFCPSCLSQLMSNFEDEYGERMYDAPYSCPICRRDIGDMLNDYWSEKERNNWHLDKGSQDYYFSINHIIHQINHLCACSWCCRPVLSGKSMCAIHFERHHNNPKRSCGHCGKNLRHNQNIHEHCKYECHVFDDYQLDKFF